ncbi:HD domain-containing protein [Flavobacterium amnicola]|uniref:HD domain-containing protein n=1 Tax=Flavobacterium amnicola TaxID=2506422 RepID=A0A4Q1K0K6_9FLAO|nr:HD domain-containing protein [Flavobacterium amnicola]RXR16232.1 HD domain-containing protein [Flavobacterium amnicola]
MNDWNSLFAYMQNCLQTKLPPYLVYHDWKHTKHVIEMAEHIALSEKIAQEEIILIKTAALFHDAGYLNEINKGHEEKSIAMSKKILPDYGYSLDEIDLITGMIEATKVPQLPKNKLEDILADADLEYLGTTTFKTRGDKLLEELQHFHPEINRESWDKIQIDFLQNHHFHTSYCLKNRDPLKQLNLKTLKKTITSKS